MKRKIIPKRLKSCISIGVTLFFSLALSMASAFALEANTLEAKIDGESVTFYLEKAAIQDWGPLNASFVSYNPRGEKEYRFLLSLPSSIDSGEYEFAKRSDPGADFYLYTTYYKSTGQWGSDYYKTTYSTGSGSFSITERNDNWTHYKGTLNLSMEKSRGRSVSVQASFDFTIGANYQVSGSSQVDSEPSYQPIPPTVEPTSEMPTDFVPESEVVERVENSDVGGPSDTSNTPPVPDEEGQYGTPSRENDFNISDNDAYFDRKDNLDLLSLAGCVGGAITLIAVVVWGIRKLITKK